MHTGVPIKLQNRSQSSTSRTVVLLPTHPSLSVCDVLHCVRFPHFFPQCLLRRGARTPYLLSEWIRVIKLSADDYYAINFFFFAKWHTGNDLMYKSFSSARTKIEKKTFGGELTVYTVFASVHLLSWKKKNREAVRPFREWEWSWHAPFFYFKEFQWKAKLVRESL